MHQKTHPKLHQVNLLMCQKKADPFNPPPVVRVIKGEVIENKLPKTIFINYAYCCT